MIVLEIDINRFLVQITYNETKWHLNPIIVENILQGNIDQSLPLVFSND